MKRFTGYVSVRLLGTLVLGVSITLVLAAILSWYHTIEFEEGLKRSVAERLENAGFEQFELRVDGREAIFVGDVDASVDRHRMLEIAEAVDGIESVRDERTVVNYARGRPFELHSYAGITTVEGELPDPRDVAAVMAAIRDHYGVDPLGADLAVRRAVRRPPWLDGIKRILEAVGPVSPLEIQYDDDTLSVSGDVEDQQTREEVTTRLRRVLGDSTRLVLHLQLPSQTREPNVRIEYKRGGVSVSGIVPEDDFAEQLIAALTLAFAVDDVESDLLIDPDVRHSSWLEGVLRVVFPLAMTNWVDFEIKQGEVTVRGSVRDDDELEILKEQIRDNFDYAVRVVNLIRRQADPEG